MDQQKTPGVYIEEKSAFPNSVVEVATAVPVFIGYATLRNAGGASQYNTAIRITSLMDYERLFEDVVPQRVDDGERGALERASPMPLSQSLKLFYDNGGGATYVFAIGPEPDESTTPTVRPPQPYIDALTVLASAAEPTMIVIPDAAFMPVADWARVTNACLNHCNELQSRITIIDIPGAHKAPNPPSDPVSEARKLIGEEGRSYGATYYPWLNTTILSSSEIDYTNLSGKVRQALKDRIIAEDPTNAENVDLANKLTKENDAQTVAQTHGRLMSMDQSYRSTMVDALAALNVMPPSSGMAGIIARTDNEIGAWKAPANTGITSVTSPTISINEDQQEDLNAPLSGLAVNAVRTFMGRGTLVWGARTLDANSADYRYISVRRTLILIEQSAKIAIEAFVFEPNDANTWAAVKAMLENFLTNLWKQGALAGSTPADAFSVSVGLGSTMTSNDILEGYMNVTLKVAVTHPAEFIVISMSQQMQKS